MALDKIENFAASMSPELKTYYSKKLLERLVPALQHDPPTTQELWERSARAKWEKRKNGS